MSRLARRVALLAIALAAAHAQAITIEFTGLVTAASATDIAGPAVGETITGRLSFDETAPASSVWTDGSSYLQRFMNDWAGGPSLLGLSGQATFSGGATITLSPTHLGADTALTVLHDNFGLNELDATAETYDDGFLGANALHLSVYDFLGLATSLFPSPTSGLSFGRYVYADGTGEQAGGFFEGATTDGFFYGSFVPTAFTISAVPETGNLALLLAGLGVVGMARRRRQAACD